MRLVQAITLSLMLAAVGCQDAIAPLEPGLPLSPRARSNAILVNERTPSALVTPNPCNGDVVTLTGTLHTVIGNTPGRNGSQLFYFDMTGTYAGTGAPSLLQYKGFLNIHHVFFSGGPLPIVETFFDEIRVTSAGGLQNYTIRVQGHVTINATGTATAEFTETTVRCDGRPGVIPPVLLP